MLESLLVQVVWSVRTPALKFAPVFIHEQQTFIFLVSTMILMASHAKPIIADC